jgi:hypothetical protein
VLTPPRGLSQPATSFIACNCQGIHLTPLSCLNIRSLKITMPHTELNFFRSLSQQMCELCTPAICDSIFSALLNFCCYSRCSLAFLRLFRSRYSIEGTCFICPLPQPVNTLSFIFLKKVFKEGNHLQKSPPAGACTMAVALFFEADILAFFVPLLPPRKFLGLPHQVFK